MVYEYKVVPAPTRGQKGKGVKGAQGRFANGLEVALNTLAAEGWEFQRSETLPSEERSGLTSVTTTYRSVMVFRRARADDLTAFQPKVLNAPVVAKLAAPASSPVAVPEPKHETAAMSKAAATDTPEAAAPLDPSALAASLATKAMAENNAKTRVLAEDEKTGTSAARDPDEGATISDISVALKNRAETIENS